MILRILLFLAINFAALGLGGLFTSKGVPSDWYVNLIKAPWTPPGWVFGAAWTTIMICLAFYMPLALKSTESKNILIGIFILQWILNVAWSPVFFKYHSVLPGLIIITLLTAVVIYMLFAWLPQTKWAALLLAPYILWLLIATSLNGYILLKN